MRYAPLILSVIFFLLFIPGVFALDPLATIDDYRWGAYGWHYGGVDFCPVDSYLYVLGECYASDCAGSNSNRRIWIMNVTNETDPITIDNYSWGTLPYWFYRGYGNAGLALSVTKNASAYEGPGVFYGNLNNNCNTICIQKYNRTTRLSTAFDIGYVTNYNFWYNDTPTNEIGIIYKRSDGHLYLMNDTATITDYGLFTSFTGFPGMSNYLFDLTVYNWTEKQAFFSSGGSTIYRVDIDAGLFIQTYDLIHYNISAIRGLAPVNSTHVWIKGTHDGTRKISLISTGPLETAPLMDNPYPVNEGEVFENILNLGIELTATDNGTLTYYLDGNLLGTVTVDTAPVFDTDYYISTGVIDDGSHSWNVIYTMSGYDFYSDTYSFTITSGIMITAGSAMADLFGFKTDDYLTSTEKGRAFVALIIIFSIGLGVGGYFKSAEIAGMAIVSFLLLFTITGDLPAWFGILLIIISGFIMAEWIKKFHK